MRMIDLVKRAGIQAFESTNPVAVLFGTVARADPLEVNVDQRFTLTAPFLIVPERLIRYEVELRHTHAYQDDAGSGAVSRDTQPALEEPTVIREGLRAGDKVALLRVQGGQQYYILDKVVEP